MTPESIVMDIDALDLIRLALSRYGHDGYAILVEYDCFRHPSTGKTATVEEIKALHLKLEDNVPG